MFDRYIFNVLCGPANGGKTSYFLNNIVSNTKFIVSIFDKQYIVPLNMSMDEFNSKCTYINLLEKNRQSYFDMDTCRIFDFDLETSICVDEIHFFSKDNLDQLDSFLKLFPKLNLYFTMLPQSHCNTLLNNTINLLSNANDLIMIKTNCKYCSQFTIQSSCVNRDLTDELFVGKASFFPMCKKCKILKQ